MATCPKCGNQVGAGAVFCDQCGARISAPEETAAPPAPAGGSVICPACGAGNVPGEAFCDDCGSPLDAPLPTVEAEPVAAETEPEAEPPPQEPLAEPAAKETAAVGEEPAPAAEEAGSTCPVCGAAVLPDEAFCADCGASLAQPPIPPEPVVEAEPVVEKAPPPKPLVLTCPACNAEIEEDDVFCSACGFTLQAAPPPVEEAAPAPSAGPRLMVAASGAEIPLPAVAEILVGREDPVSGIYPEVDLTPHGGEDGGVSRRHARLIVEGGDYFVEDLDSTNFTFVNKQKIAPKTRTPVKDGDEIRCGRVALVLKLGN